MQLQRGNMLGYCDFLLCCFRFVLDVPVDPGTRPVSYCVVVRSIVLVHVCRGRVFSAFLYTFGFGFYNNYISKIDARTFVVSLLSLGQSAEAWGSVYMIPTSLKLCFMPSGRRTGVAIRDGGCRIAIDSQIVKIGRYVCIKHG